MCGIFAAINFNSFFNQNDFKLFVDSTNMVTHRGPDSFGFYYYNTFSRNNSADSFNVFLGHRRLSIIDLSILANQPMVLDNTVIVYNGEIFNYIELRDKLIKKGCIFNSGSDTEVILHMYKLYGSKSFAELNGMWSFIIFDLDSNDIIISRDRFSIKPLYYYQNNNILLLSSEIKQLLPFVEKKIETEILYTFLVQGITDYEERTYFSGIKRILPSHNMIINLYNNSLKYEKYWEYQIYNHLDIDSCFEEFRFLFEDSIKLRLRSDVQIGGLLSGGLDSSAVSVIAQKIIPKEYNTFSIISDSKYSEEKFIDILIHEKNIANTKIPFRSNHPFELLDRVLCIQDEPFGSFSIIAQNEIYKLIKKTTDIKVVLSGQGADEILLGYLKYYFFYLRELLSKKQFISLSREILHSIINKTIFKQFSLKTAKRYLPCFMSKKPEYLNISGKPEAIWNIKTIKDLQINDLSKYSIPNLNRYEDRNSMSASIESRNPFLDHRLVNFLLSVPTNLKIQKGWTKYIMRKSIHELPDKIRWRKDKRNFFIPEEEWIKNTLYKEITSLFEKSILHEMGIIDKWKFLDYYGDFRKSKQYAHFTDISRVLITEKWARKYF